VTSKCIAITGCDGFIGRNLTFRLQEGGHKTVGLSRSSDDADWSDAIERADVIVHLAAANRPEDPADFDRINVGSTTALIAALTGASSKIPVIYTSSVRARLDDDYGRSKRTAEEALLAYSKRSGAAIHMFRLPNVFGKWARPNYNSAVATFCHNVARDLPISVHDPAAPLQLVYIDDVIEALVSAIEGKAEFGFNDVGPIYDTSVGVVAKTIRGFRADRADNLIDEVGTGLTRALYATYVSFLPPAEFSYPILSHRDPRGTFSEMLKTRTSGQFSYFTALPGVTRGGHYHHSKTEKFLIVHGNARFRFRHMVTGEAFEIQTNAEQPTVVETVPGWTHDVTNISDTVMISLLWANEIFDAERPDTIVEEI